MGVQLTPDGRTVDASFTMPDYVGKAIVPDLAARLDFPVVAANDLICGAIAEYHYGSLGDWDLVAYLTVSTGTGAGIYLRSGDTAVAYLAQIGHHIWTRPADNVAVGRWVVYRRSVGRRRLRNVTVDRPPALTTISSGMM